ncbi:MAG: 50S ribosomal protein L30 [Candidatus Delongbacteria bacterium]|nr:50S ribosomal protein L30 [Candidatus Delongbacteria bacterium]
MSKIIIKLIHSPIRRPGNQRLIAEALGLRRLNQTVIHEDCPSIRGMATKIAHLVDVQKIDK